jgi:hypothetical protein
MIKFFKKGVYFLILVILFAACKKQVAGPKGESGINGKNGNANQSHIKEFTLLSQDWKTNTVRMDWNASIATELITDDVIQKGMVCVYLNVNGRWTSIPHAFDDFRLQYKLSKGVIGLNYLETHGVAAQPGAMNIKVSIVSPK